MIEETLKRLEERIRSSERTGDGTRTELLELVGDLRTEFASVAESHHDDAAAIAERAAIAEHEGKATAESPAAGVEGSMLEFESAHPRIVGLFHSLMRTLADAGI
jgi:hypothetical protein